MAAGFITKPLSTLLLTVARWIEYSDGSTSPVHGSVVVDPTSGLPVDLNLPAEIVGSVANAAADSGKPLKVGGTYRLSNQTLVDGNRGDVALTNGGAQIAALAGNMFTGSDGLSNANIIYPLGADASRQTTSLRTGLAVALQAYNGVTWDRLRTAGSLLGLFTEAGPYLASRKTADGQVKAAAGFVHTITIAPLTATPTAGLLTVYDSLTETGTVIYSEWVFATTPGHTVTLDVPCGTGIYVGFDATLANVGVTLAYR